MVPTTFVMSECIASEGVVADGSKSSEVDEQKSEGNNGLDTESDAQSQGIVGVSSATDYIQDIDKDLACNSHEEMVVNGDGLVPEQSNGTKNRRLSRSKRGSISGPSSRRNSQSSIDSDGASEERRLSRRLKEKTKDRVSELSKLRNEIGSGHNSATEDEEDVKSHSKDIKTITASTNSENIKSESSDFKNNDERSSDDVSRQPKAVIANTIENDITDINAEKVISNGCADLNLSCSQEQCEQSQENETNVSETKPSHASPVSFLKTKSNTTESSASDRRSSYSPRTKKSCLQVAGKKTQRAKMSLSPNRMNTKTIDNFFKPLNAQSSQKAKKSLVYNSQSPTTLPKKSTESVDVLENSSATVISSDAATEALSALHTNDMSLPHEMPYKHYDNDVENTPVPVESAVRSNIVKMPKAKKSFPRSNVGKNQSTEQTHAGENSEFKPKLSSNLSLIPNKTFKLKDLEYVFGIGKKLETKLDGKSLDKLLLEKTMKHKDAGKVGDNSLQVNTHSETSNTNFASLLTSQKILNKRNKNKRKRFGQYNLPSQRRTKRPAKPSKPRDVLVSDKQSVPKSMSEPVGNVCINKSNKGVDDILDASVELVKEPEKNPSELQLENKQKVSRGFRGRRKRSKRPKIPKYIRARLRNMQRQIHSQGYDGTELMKLDEDNFVEICRLENSRKRKRSTIPVDDDSLSVSSNATSLAESDHSMLSKDSQGSKRIRSEEIPALLPISDIPIVNHALVSNAVPPKITPHKFYSGVPCKISTRCNRLNVPLSRGLECLNAVPGAAKRDIEGASGAGESKYEGQMPYKYHNTPNGITYPVTPPHTPEHAARLIEAEHADSDNVEIVGSDRRSDYTTTCLCKINMVAGPLPPQRINLYCQALDSVNGKIMGCCNRVTNAHMVRPSQQIPFLVLCEVHRQRLRLHQCCPGCGQFCTEGKFMQCKSEMNKKGAVVLHHFHAQCQTYKTDKFFCPHCARESCQFEVNLKFNGQRTSWTVIENHRLGKQKSSGQTARMGNIAPSLNTDEATKPALQMSIASSSKILTSKSLPLGPARSELEDAISILDSDRVKKLRPGVKNLFKACKSGDLEKVLLMLGDGTDPNQRYEDESNESPLHAAATGGHHLVTHLLLQAGANPHAVDNELCTPLMLAAERGHMSVVQTLVKAGALVDARRADGMTSLHLAAQAGKVDAVTFLLETKKININVKDDGGWTSLIWAAEHKNLDVVHHMLAMGGDPNIHDNEGNTALHWAAYSGSTDIAEIFLNAGCDLETVNELGDRPLHIAARQDHYECVVLFLARGADSEARNNQNESALGCCIDQNSSTWMALRVNRQLQGVAAVKLHRSEQLLHRSSLLCSDISYGREGNPIPVVNMVDHENYPTDFHYVAENVETTPMNINRVITSLQSCKCKENCGSVFCDCSHNSVRCWFEKDGKLVKDFSYTDPPMIFECNKACRCWTTCQNRVVQLGITCRLQVFRTEGRGWGARTLLDIPQGSFVCEYVGELISDAEADSREDDSYLFDLDNKDSDTYCIDARRYGNIARFINHLCQPNLIPVKVFIDHQDLRFPRICFFASRDIKAYEELGFDYGEKFWIIKWKHFTCTCGSPKCRYSKETIHKTLEEYYRRQREEEQLVELQQ